MPNRLRRKLFNRAIDRRHPLYPVIDTACQSTRGVNEAVLNNMALDHRVPPEREASFMKFCGSDPGAVAGTLLQMLRRYEEREVRLKGFPDGEPAYLRRENAANLLHGDMDFRRDLLDPTTRLITVKTARDIEGGLRRRLGSRFGSDRVDPVDPQALLDVFFNELSTVEQGELLHEALVEFLNRPYGSSTTPKRDPGCVWATYAGDMAHLIDADPLRWFEFLGLKTYRGEGIAFIVAYRVADTGALARPTQLDAGVYPPHLPPPPVHGHPSSTLPWGGLCGQSGAREMLLHQQVVEDERLSVLRWKRYRFDTDGPSADELFRARTRRLRSWSQLSDAYRSVVKDWICN